MLIVDNLWKTYQYRGKTTDAVAGLSFTLSEGRILGMLGPNGAGKTTTLRMLATLIRPTRGCIQVNGVDTRGHERNIRQNIAYVPQAGTLLGESTVGTELVYQGQLLGLSASEARTQAKKNMALIGSSDLFDRRASHLSGGQQRKVDIAMAMLAHPSLMYLDEPTVGLDPDARQEVWELIRMMHSQLGTTIVLTTHYLEEAESVATDITMLDKGRAVAKDTTVNLRNQFALDTIEISVDRRIPQQMLLALQQNEAIKGIDFLPTAEEFSDYPTFRVRAHHGDRVLPRILERLTHEGIRVQRIHVDNGGLEDAFFNLTGKNLEQ